MVLTFTDLTIKLAKSHWIKESLLSNESYCLDIITHLKAYFDINKAEDTNPAIKWANKASVWGFLIQLASGLKKACDEVILVKN